MEDQTVYNGTIRSFNVNSANGYGFITCAESFALYGGDVYLHRNEFTNSGAAVGQTVTFNVTLSDKGQPRSCNVAAVGEPPEGAMTAAMAQQCMEMGGMGTLGGGNQDYKRGMAGMDRGGFQGGPVGPYSGLLKMFNQEKGYGFILCEETQQDVFVHYSEALNFRVGEQVTFSIEPNGQDKQQARGLRRMDGSIPVWEGINEEIPPGWFHYNPNGSGYGQGGNYGGNRSGGNNSGGLVPLGDGSGDGEGATATPGGGSSAGAKKGKGKGQWGKDWDWDLPFPPHKEFHGYVKAYWEEKGFGFIECDETWGWFERDVFLSKDQVEPFKLEQGSEILFRVVSKAKGPQADIVGKIEDLVKQGQEKLKSIGEGPHSGVIKNYNETKGFGFIECPATYIAFEQDVFMHKMEMGALIAAGAGVGSSIQFNVSLNRRGKPQATMVTLVDGVPASKRQQEEASTQPPAHAFDILDAPNPPAHLFDVPSGDATTV